MNTIYKWDTIAIVNDENRSKKWTSIIGKNELPIKSILPIKVIPVGCEPKLAYEVDLPALSDQQIERIAEAFNLTKDEFIQDCKDGRPLLIDADQVTVSTTDHSQIMNMVS